MKYRAHLSAVLAAALLAAGCASTTTGSVASGGSARSQLLLVSPEQVMQQSLQYYDQQNTKARAQGKLVTSGAEWNRVNTVMQRLVPHVATFRPDAARWPWQLVLIDEDTVNAHVMAGGKITFYTGIIRKLRLTDDEIAAIMGHEMAHALREHARERIAKTQATGLGLSVAASLFGLGQLGELGANIGTQLLSLKYSRDDETEADLVGLEVAARGAYDPDASVSLWNKMMAASKRQGGTSFLSSHPSGPDRIRQLQANIPRVEGLYRQAQRTQPAASPALARQPVGTPTGTPRYDTPIGRAIDAR